MTLVVHRAERSDRLASALGELLAQPLADPLAEEVIAVPARGIERWLTQRLAHRLGTSSQNAPDAAEDGICAGVRFPSPSRLVSEILGLTAGGASEERDPWAPDLLVWPLLEVIDECAGEPWCATLGDHLGATVADHDASDVLVRQSRRLGVAMRLARLFWSYALHRPAMLEAWLAARGSASAVPDTDGFGTPLPPDLRWQAELWRRLEPRVAGPNPVERLAGAAERVRRDPAAIDLPERVSLFGPTRLATSQLRLLAALAEHRDVHLWLPHPSPALWRAVAAVAPAEPVRRDEDPTALIARHPLLASLGRDAREMQLVLTAAGAAAADEHHPADAGAAGTAAPTLLRSLQALLRDDVRPTPGERVVLAPDDRSVQVHACHGAARQVDVVREVLVGLLEADPTLEPRDVLVMCPDIEVYAPLVSAGFGLADVVTDGHPAHRLRVRLADRALGRTNPLLATVERILDLAGGRVTASQVLDLAAWPPVRRRFGLDDDDLEQVARWVAEAGVRWGFDEQHREPFGLGRFPQNTWRTGLDRLLLGVTMADEDRNWLGLALPLDDVESTRVDLAGRFAEYVDRLENVLDGLAEQQSLEDWLDALGDGVRALTSVADADEWQVAELHRELRWVAEAAGDRAPVTELALADVRTLFGDRLAGRPTRANFRTGTLTVCTMVPMRSVPHRVICLLGLDDGAFPRGARLDGDDVLARSPAVGERDPRGEDRQLMLDAILAATEHLVITYAGADERTGAQRPPSVPVGELLDAVDDAAVTADGSPARAQVEVRHPLQPFDRRNFTLGELGTRWPFSHDRSALAGALAAAGGRRAPAPFLAAALAPRTSERIDLDTLVSAIERPVRAFLRERLDVAIRFEADEPADGLTVELDALQEWAIGDRLLADRLAGADVAATRQAEWRRGALPPGRLGERTLDRILAEVEPLVSGTETLRSGEPETIDLAVTLDDGRAVRGSVAGVYDGVVVSIGYSRLGARQRLRSWVRLVALAAARPDRAWRAMTVGRGQARQHAVSHPRCSTLGPLDEATARDLLHQLVDLADRAAREPLPLAARTSAAYADARRRDDPPAALRHAAGRWTSERFPGEGQDPAHVQVWGPDPPLGTLLVPSRDDESWYGEPNRFAELALRLWWPLLDHETTDTL